MTPAERACAEIDLLELPWPTRGRDRAVDALRGLAVLLMVLDHVLVQVEPLSPLRFTVTRLSLPLFVGCAATVHRGTMRPRRVAALLAVGLLEAVDNPWLHLGTPGPVLLIGGTALVMCWEPARSRAGLLGALGLLQALYLPVAWSGYQPGLVLAWWVLGVVLVDALRPLAWRFDALAFVGRGPLRFYVAHLLILLPLFGGR